MLKIKMNTISGVDISEEECMYLYALGPSCRNLSKCDGPEQPISYSTFITKQLIQHTNISHDALVGLRLVDRDQLRVGGMVEKELEMCLSLNGIAVNQL
jgi:hypothetical protein